MSLRSGFALVCCLVGTWVGCAGKSETEFDGQTMYPSAGGAAGSAHHGAGKGGVAGKGGGNTGATGGSTSETGGSGAVGTGGTIGTGGSIAAGGGPARGGTGGSIGTGGTSTGGGAGRGGNGATGGVGAGGSAGRPGTGGASGTAGRAPFGMGGAQQAGTGGVAGSMATGGAGGGPMPPAGWSCATNAYADGTCDCGCGAKDSDCVSGAIDQCGRCNGAGSCSAGACPGHIDPTDTTKCAVAPAGWTCSAAAYSDGSRCDCGCGALDPDCGDQTLGSCDTCNGAGACGHSQCPASIDPSDNTKCSVPDLWTCDPYYYGDGYCNCGCGVKDADCSSTLSSSCWSCPGDSCSPYSCSTLVSNDNAHCTSAPYTWTCATRLYHDGSQCDCGCGAFDPDCASIGADACDTCSDSGACSKQACPGTITKAQNWLCSPPTPPSSWICGSYAYGDGFTCDCGCGAPDPDCASSDVSACNYCPACVGICPASVDPNDTTRCLPPPPTWTCDVSRFGDYTCDCGCGAVDVDCYATTSDACGNCPTDGCSAGVCSHIDANDNSQCSIVPPSNWTCSPEFYADRVCDCGCGAHDPDCSTTDESSCVYCNSTGSCSSTKCPGTILSNDNTACSQ